MAEPMSRRILHLITGLGRGGAETTLSRLLAHADGDRFHASVVSLLPEGDLGDRIRGLGIEVSSLGMRRGFPDPGSLAHLVGLLRRVRPDVVQTWMYHADLLGGLASKGAGRGRVVWNLRHTQLDAHSPRLTRWTVRTCAATSSWLASRIVCGSRAALAHHARLGYDPDKLMVVQNGFDLRELTPRPGDREDVRRELQLADSDLAVGLVARFDPHKDHRTFVRAASETVRRLPSAHFVLCGPGTDARNEELVGWIRRAGLASRFRLLGARQDPTRVMAGFDVGALCSTSEGFPNVVAEMMACGLTCVVTDVGDAAEIVGDTGLVVPPSDPHALSRACCSVLSMAPEQRRARGRSARRRIAEHFGLERFVRGYECVWDQLTDRP